MRSLLSRKALLLSVSRGSRSLSATLASASPPHPRVVSHRCWWTTSSSLLRHSHGHCFSFTTSSPTPDDPVSFWDGPDIAHEISSRGWHISEDSDGDWRSNASAIARSLQLIKGRMKVRSYAQFSISSLFFEVCNVVCMCVFSVWCIFMFMMYGVCKTLTSSRCQICPMHNTHTYLDTLLKYTCIDIIDWQTPKSVY